MAAAAAGCQALLLRHTQPGLAQLPQQAGVGLVQQFVGIHVQGLDYKGRSACYQLLLEVLRVRLLLLLLLPPINHHVCCVCSSVSCICNARETATYVALGLHPGGVFRTGVAV